MQTRFKRRSYIALFLVLIGLVGVGNFIALGGTVQEDLDMLFMDDLISINHYDFRGDAVSEADGVVQINVSRNGENLTYSIDFNRLIAYSIKIKSQPDSILVNIRGQEGAVAISGTAIDLQTKEATRLDKAYGFLEMEFNWWGTHKTTDIANALKACFKDFCHRNATITVDIYDMRGRLETHKEIH
jgi:hypothetical protein